MKGFTPYSGAFRQNSWAQLFLLQPIFSAIAACVPPSVDSNMLTCASTFILFLLSLSIALASDPVLSLLPVLLYLLCSLGTFSSLVLSNVDFLQAKRTKSNASQADLLQLVCDVANVPMYTYIIARVLILSPTQSIWLLVCVFSCFYLAACGAAAMGAIPSSRFTGPAEAVVAIAVISLITVFSTPIIWQFVIDTGYFPGIQINHLLLMIATIFMFWYLCCCIEHIMKGTELFLPTGKSVSSTPRAVSCIIHCLSIAVCVWIWHGSVMSWNVQEREWKGSNGVSVVYPNLALIPIGLLYACVICATHAGVAQKHTNWLYRRASGAAMLLLLNHLPYMLGVWEGPMISDDVWGGLCSGILLVVLSMYLRNARDDLQLMIIND